MKNLVSRAFLQVVGAVLISFLFGGLASQAFASIGYEVPIVVPSALVFATMCIPKGQVIAAYASSLDLSLLPSKLKDYNMANKTELLTKLMMDGRPEYMTLLAGVKDEVPLTELAIGSIVQPGSKDTFDPLNNVIQFKANIGKVRECKVDLQFKHTQVLNLWKSYYGQVMAGAIDPYVLPYEAYIMEKIIAKAHDDIRKIALFKGVYNAAGTAPIDLFDGLLTKVAAYITAGGIPAGNVATGAAITATNAYDQMMLIVDALYANGGAYVTEPLVALMAPENARFYFQDYAATRGAIPYNTSFEKKLVEGTNIEIIAEPGMTGSDRIIVTPKSNLFFLIDEENQMNDVKTEYALRNINIMMDFRMAPEIGIQDLIWTNNLA
jgi:hypothetical protein